MRDTTYQTDIYGRQIRTSYDDLDFSCPICHRPMFIKRRKKGGYYFLNWIGHFVHRHGDDAIRHVPEDITLWLFFLAISDRVETDDLMDRWIRSGAPYKMPEEHIL